MREIETGKDVKKEDGCRGLVEVLDRSQYDDMCTANVSAAILNLYTTRGFLLFSRLAPPIFISIFERCSKKRILVYQYQVARHLSVTQFYTTVIFFTDETERST